MEQQIIVYTADGVVSRTYPRRAKQLVLSGRAKWANDKKAIYLTPPIKEGYSMETTQPIAPTELPGRTAIAKQESINDDVLHELARRKVKERSSIWISLGAAIILFIFGMLSFFAVNENFASFVLGVSFTVGLHFIWKLVMYNSLSIRRYRSDPVETEYNKLKLMNADHIAELIKKM